MSDKKIVWNRKTKIVVLMVIAVVYLAGIFIWGIFMNPEKYAVNYANKFLSPSLKHPFGTDFVGRDMFYRCVKGLSNSIVIGILASIVSSIVALIFGIAAAVFGKWVDKVVNWGVFKIYLLQFPSIVNVDFLYVGKRSKRSNNCSCINTLAVTDSNCEV